MDTGLRDEIGGAPTISSEEALVSKDKEQGYMVQVRCRWDRAQNVVFEDSLLRPKCVNMAIFRYAG